VEVADALADLQYVLSGTILDFGMQHIFKYCFEEVHCFNMSKACSSWDLAERTCEFYLHTKSVDSYIRACPTGGGYLVLRKSDDKILKSIYYSVDSPAVLG
jgi:Phosphoribosyl-ATP pyrophosphohydrolase.